MRSTFASIAALALVVTTFTACGELTGPVSPSTPTNVVATLTSATSATIKWTPSPLNDGVISYSVFRDGVKVGESTTSTFADTGLTQQKTFVYSVAANCKSGIISERSAETAASTVTTLDITAPRIISNQPPTGSTNVSPSATATVTFSEAIDPATINTTTFSLRVTGGAAIAGTVTYNATTRTAEFRPTSDLPNPVSITATVTTGVKDLAGNALAAAFTWVFSTRDITPPSVIASSPTAGQTGVAPGVAINITFNDAMDATTINATTITLRTTAGGTNIPGTVTYSSAARVATFTPNAPLAQTTGYTLSVSTGVKDAAGNALSPAFTLAFTTGDTNSPSVVSVTPANNATNVALATTVRVTFSEPMDPVTINSTTVSLRNTATSAVVPATVTYDAATNTAILTPTSPLASITNYTVTVSVGAKDTSGNGLGSPFTSTFTTLNADTVPPTVTAVVPANAATGVATSAIVQITFSEPMDATTINNTNIRLTVTATSTAVAGTVSYNAATNTATFAPSAPLAAATNYTVIVTTLVKDLAGNSLATQFTSTFTTAPLADTTAPTIITRFPANGATNVAVSTNATVTFSESLDPASVTGTTFTLTPTAGGAAIPATVSYTPGTNIVTIDPTADLSNNTSYTLTVTNGVKDVAGNALAATSTSTFTTIPDTTSPTVIARTPTAATGVPVGTTVTFTFSENMDPATITTATVTLNVTAGAAVAGTVAYNAATRVATFTPSASLTPGTSYTATVTTGAKDTAGNALTGNFSFAFTTAP